MKNFLQPAKSTIVIYLLFLLNNTHLLFVKLIDHCDQSMSYCVQTTTEIIWIISFFILLPIKLFSSIFDIVYLILNPIVSFIILIFIYYLYAASITYLFKNKRRMFCIIIIIIPIIVIIGGVLIYNLDNQTQANSVRLIDNIEQNNIQTNQIEK